MKAISLLASLVVLAISGANAYAGDFSGILKSQTSYGSDTDKLQQQEWLFDLEYNASLLGGSITAILSFTHKYHPNLPPYPSIVATHATNLSLQGEGLKFARCNRPVLLSI